MATNQTVAVNRRDGKRRGYVAKGFTLIELLVVIAIISLLVSILMPSLSKAKELAKQAVCSSKLRTVGLGHTMYANDNKGEFFYLDRDPRWLNPGAVLASQPEYYPHPPLASGRYPDMVEVGGYLPKESYYCPNFLGNLSPAASIENEWNYNRISYCMFVNCYLEGLTTPPGPTPDGDNSKRKIDRLDNVSPSEAMAQDPYIDSTGGFYGPGLRANHEDGSNVLFTDTHVEFVGPNGLTGEHNAPGNWYIPGTWWMYPDRM